MKLVFISDTHGYLHKVDVPDGDVLIHCGDALSSGRLAEFETFVRDLQYLLPKFDLILYTPGNHDICVEEMPDVCKRILSEASPKIKMLLHEPFEYKGVKFFGSPYTPRFGDWSFMEDRDQIGAKWAQIPGDTDVLFCHGMPKDIMDSVGYVIGVGEERVGCEALRDRVAEIEPTVFAGGHLHLEGGQQEVIDNTTFINAAICDDSYTPLRAAQVFELSEKISL
jgi:Icc-related predicted phosphoesterase